MTVKVPHQQCQDTCKSVSLYSGDKLISSYKLLKSGAKPQQSISFSGLSNGQYDIKFSADPAGKRFVLKNLEVNHYSVETALKVFLLGLVMFGILIGVLYGRVNKTNKEAHDVRHSNQFR